MENTGLMPAGSPANAVWSSTGCFSCASKLSSHHCGLAAIDPLTRSTLCRLLVRSKIAPLLSGGTAQLHAKAESKNSGCHDL